MEEKQYYIYWKDLNSLLIICHRKPTFLYQYLPHPSENHNKYLKDEKHVQVAT
mgnify:CR=1 FL=1